MFVGEKLKSIKEVIKNERNCIYHGVATDECSCTTART